MGDPLTWLANLAERADGFPAAGHQRPYWSERLASGPNEPSVLTLESTARRVHTLIEEMKEEFYFAETLGFDCVDGHGDVLTSLEAQLRNRVGKPMLWTTPAVEWDKDDLCDLIEVFHDLAARPATGWHHSYQECGWHPTTYSRRSGQAIYRWKVNLLLDGSGMGVRLADDGEDLGRIVEMVPEGLADLTQEALQLHSMSQKEITHAVALYRTRDASREMKRSAVIALAGVLENRRSDLKHELLRKDEAALFVIANNFNLRHSDANQRSDYRDEFLDWLFCWYLATIRLIETLQPGSDA